jgi:hypothetical protein
MPEMFFIFCGVDMLLVSPPHMEAVFHALG